MATENWPVSAWWLCLCKKTSFWHQQSMHCCRKCLTDSYKSSKFLGHKRPECGTPVSSPQSNIRSPQCKKQSIHTVYESNKLTGRTESEMMTTHERPACSTNIPSTFNFRRQLQFFFTKLFRETNSRKGNLFNYNFLQGSMLFKWQQIPKPSLGCL